MKEIIKKITYAGFSEAKNSHDRKSVLIVNRMSLILIILMILFVVLSPIIAIEKAFYFSISFLIIFSLTPFFNTRGWLTFSKYYFSFVPVLGVMVICYNNPGALGDRYFFLTTAVIPILLFRKTWVVYSIFYVSVAAFIAMSFYQWAHPVVLNISERIQVQYFYFVMLSVFAILFYVVRYFKQDSDEFEKIIEEKKTELAEKNKEIVDSINYAKRIQHTLLANTSLLNKNLPEYFLLFKPKDIVSGDFYWATQHNNKFYLAVCDSTGHGVPGAFMSLLNISFLNEAISERKIEQPHEILNHCRRRLIENISQEGAKDGMDGILVCFEKVAALAETRITYAAANNAPVIVSNNTVTYLPCDKMPVGHGEKEESFTLQTVQAKKGDRFYLYTDGYADQFGGPKGKKFKYKQLNELLLNSSNRSLNDQKTILEKTFTDWQGRLEQVDDVCIIGIKV